MSEEESTLDLFLKALQHYKDEGLCSPEEADSVREDVLGAQEHLDKHGSLGGYKSKEK